MKYQIERKDNMEKMQYRDLVAIMKNYSLQ